MANFASGNIEKRGLSALGRKKSQGWAGRCARRLIGYRLDIYENFSGLLLKQ
jgi:hypothetical protein